MNYMPQDPTKQTSCRNCLFAIYDGDTQTGCEANRIEKFGNFVVEAYDDSKEFYVINRFCNLYRPLYWNNGIKDIVAAKKETCVTFDLLIDCDEIDEEYYDIIKHELHNINYTSQMYKVVLFYSYESTKEQKQLVLNIYKEFPNINFSIYFNKIDYIYGFLSKTRNSFHVILNKNNIKDCGIFINKVNELINEDLKRFVICKDSNRVAISSTTCRILYPTLYLDYETKIVELEKDSKEQNLFVEI